uniref:Beta-Casp domain-containing protein n=1 Tax=Romanomermis culicivorax TaxID=13658 RepID=A0A915KW76_ROMCU
MEDSPNIKLHCFSSVVNSPCFVLKWPEISVMLDCTLNLQSLLNFTPCSILESQKLVTSEPSAVDIENVNLDEIDVILISNHKSLLALPYITENMHFKGAVYATDPTLQFGREISQLLNLEPQFWRQIYSSSDVENCLTKIKLVSHREIIDLQGLLKISPVSSGYCIGGCNWVIETDYQKNSDALIFACLRQNSSVHQNPDLMMTDFCKSIISNLKMGGNVLAPCYSTGLIFDQLECLCSEMDQSSLSHVPIYILGFSMESSMAFANIYAEWLSENKQSKVFIPEEPFLHGYLMKNERIKVYTTCYQSTLSADLRTPCVVFASHPSLRLGDAVHFMQIWGRDPKNLLILTEPDFISPEVLSPYQPLAMKVIFCPIDTNLNASAFYQIINEIKPGQLFLPEQMENKRFEDKLSGSTKIKFYAKNRIIDLGLDNYDQFRKMIVESTLSSNIDLKKCDQDHYAANLRGRLSIFENKLLIKACDSADNHGIKFDQIQPIGPKIKISNLIDQLKNAGFEPLILEQKENEILIILENARISLKLEENRTRLISDEFSDENQEEQEKMRLHVLDIVLNCLDKV